jgi:hypothetical protein
MYGNSGTLEGLEYINAPLMPNGCGGVYLPPSPPTSLPSGIVDQAAEMVGSAIGEIVSARKDLDSLGDRLLGAEPKPGCDKASSGTNPGPSGRGHVLLANINTLHREIADMRSRVSRLQVL